MNEERPRVYEFVKGLLTSVWECGNCKKSFSTTWPHNGPHMPHVIPPAICLKCQANLNKSDN